MDTTRAHVPVPGSTAVPVPAARRAEGTTGTGSAAAGADVRDLRGGAAVPWRLRFATGDLVVVSGLPGSGKSTLMRRTVPKGRIDSQDTREAWARRMPSLLPYALYRPLARFAHYARLWRAVTAGDDVVVHDCGTQPWVRLLLSRAAGRRGRSLHLLMLDVDPEAARAGQRSRGRGVSRYAFRRHRRATARLLAGLERGELPRGCADAVILDRSAADHLAEITFGATGRGSRDPAVT